VAAGLQTMLDGKLEPTKLEDDVEIDNTFQRYFLKKAANPYNSDFFARHSQFYDLLFDWEGQDRATAIATVRQHRKILSALLAKDWLSARNSLSHHIRENHPILSQIEPLLS
jgi:DNA-binding GntR family transcriptional regulator